MATSKLPSVNTLLRDASIEHAIDLTRYANSLTVQTIRLLNRADAELLARLQVALETLTPDSYAVRRIEEQLRAVKALNAEVYAKVHQGMESGLRELTEYELGFQERLLRRVPPVQLPLTSVTIEVAFAAVRARPFQGKLLREWASTMEAGRMQRIREAVRMGVIQQEPIADIVRRIRGTRAAKYADGIMQIDRRSAEAIVRTAVSHTAAVSRNTLYQANADILKAVQWISTLDDKTTPDCQVRDGLRYTCDTHQPIGHTIPWKGGPGMIHWGCRSTSTPVLKSLEEMGLGGVEYPKGLRSAMDGAVPEDTTFGDWIARQPHDRKLRVLGRTRYELMEKSGATFDRFFSDRGVRLTVAQLRMRDETALSNATL